MQIQYQKKGPDDKDRTDEIPGVFSMMDPMDGAQAYYNHPVLGSRLIEITKALLEHSGKPAKDILSPIDARKVRSSMTLFWLASANPLFKEVIDVFYEGKMDYKTIRKIEENNEGA